MSYARLTEEQLLASARTDGGCIAELLRRYEPMLLRMAASFPALGHDDCLQEGGMALVDAVMHYNPTRATRFGTYAYVCVRNRLLRLQKKAQKVADWHDMQAQASTMPTPEETLLSEEALEESKAAARRVLSTFEYAVWRMRIDGYSYAEIAVALSDADKQVDVKSVNNALVRVRAKLRGKDE